MIGHLCVIDFILFRHIKEDGFGSLIMCGEGLGTPRHPLSNGYLPSSVPSRLLSIDCWFKLCTNVPISVMQYTKNGTCNLTSFGFD